jgi:tetratricopeptide (TPR) repeat protein
VVAGDFDKALEFWKQAFVEDPSYRNRIIELLAPRVPASQMITEFEPNLEGLAHLYSLYRQRGADNQARIVAPHYVKLVEETAFAVDSHEAIRHWTNAERVYRFLGDTDSELRCLSRAVDCSPDDYTLRRRLAARLITANQFDDAVEQLRWCRRRKPHDAHIKQLWTNAERMRSKQAIEMSLNQKCALSSMGNGTNVEESHYQQADN